MIVLRKPKLSTNIVLGGQLTGIVNGSNQVFYTSNNYKTDTISIDYNGQTLYPPGDFTQSGSNQITFVYIIPDISDVLKVNYEVDI